ncbi:hypothetical protein [Streptomyces sp. NPDC127038]
MSKKSLPRYSGPMSDYCWAEHPNGGFHCFLPAGHAGTHYHPYRRKNW